MLLLSLLTLAGLATAGVAAPAVARGPEAGGTVIAFRQPNFVEFLNMYEGTKCSKTFKRGEIKSFHQAPYTVCMYYQTRNCAAGNPVPSLLHDTTDGRAFDWADMNEWSGKIVSWKCGLKHQSREAPPAFAVTVYTEPNFSGKASRVTSLAKCSPNFRTGTIKSIKQAKGAVCHYYQTQACQNANHVPIWRPDSVAAEWVAADLGMWSGKIQSFSCDMAAAVADVDAVTPA